MTVSVGLFVPRSDLVSDNSLACKDGEYSYVPSQSVRRLQAVFAGRQLMLREFPRFQPTEVSKLKVEIRLGSSTSRLIELRLRWKKGSTDNG